MAVWSYVRKTLLNPHSQACVWRHPVHALRMVLGVASNGLLGLSERIRPSGRQVCPVCNWQGRRFRTFISPDIVIPASICPECGSFDRHRHLVLGMRERLVDRRQVPRSLLGLSLSPAMSYLVAHEGLGRCYRSDYDLRDARHAPDAAIDLTAAGFADASFDWVICSHVLEHIPDLDSAVDELARILRPGGHAWIQVAYNDELAESRRIPLDLRVFDAHAWRFGRDFSARLGRPTWEVSCCPAVDLDPSFRRRHGIHPVERYWRARKHS